jgi:hypothetical protein
MIQESAAQAMLRGAKEDGVTQGILQEKIRTVKRMIDLNCATAQMAAAVGLSETELTEFMKSPAYNSVI